MSDSTPTAPTPQPVPSEPTRDELIARLAAIQNWRLSASLTPGQDAALCELARVPRIASEPTRDVLSEETVGRYLAECESQPLAADAARFVPAGRFVEVCEDWLRLRSALSASDAALAGVREQVERLTKELQHYRDATGEYLGDYGSFIQRLAAVVRGDALPTDVSATGARNAPVGVASPVSPAQAGESTTSAHFGERELLEAVSRLRAERERAVRDTEDAERWRYLRQFMHVDRWDLSPGSQFGVWSFKVPTLEGRSDATVEEIIDAARASRPASPEGQ